MAQISSPFVGIAKGKLGEGVYYRAGGKTLARARNRQPRNPKSTAQCQQRLVFSTATRTAKALREIIDHSFEGVEYGQVSVNHFTKQAVAALKSAILNPIMAGVTPYVPALPLGDLLAADATGRFLPAMLASYPVSAGSLPANRVQLVAKYDDDPFPGTQLVKLNGTTAVASATTTLTQLSEFGMQIGRQYTFIFIGGKASVSDGTFVFNSPRSLSIARVNFRSDVELTTPLFIAADDAFKLNPAVLDLETSTNYGNLYFIPATDKLGFSGTAIAADSTENGCLAAAVITSEYVGGAWRRSTQNLVTLEDDVRKMESPAAAEIISGVAWNSLTDLLNSIGGEGAYASDWELNQSPNA